MDTFIGYNSVEDHIEGKGSDNVITMIMNWNITPALPDAYYSKTLVMFDTPPAPTVTLLFETTGYATWDKSGYEQGYPICAYYASCGPEDQPSTATPRVEGREDGYIPGLQQGTTYTCYTVARSPLGELYSTSAASTKIVVPASQSGPWYNISRSSGSNTYWALKTGTYDIYSRDGGDIDAPLSFAFSDFPGNNAYAAITVETNDTTRVLVDTGDWWVHLEGYPRVGFRFWETGGGKYAIQNTDGDRYLGLDDQATDPTQVRMVENTTLIVTDWVISPTPPAQYVGGTFVAP